MKLLIINYFLVWICILLTLGYAWLLMPYTFDVYLVTFPKDSVLTGRLPVSW